MIPARMPAVVHYALKEDAVELREVPVPKIGAGEVLVEVGGVGVCGSEIHQWHNTHSWPVDVPVILGHEFCGRVAAVGPSVAGWSEGDWVTSETAAEIDATSPLSRAGMYNLDPKRRGFGYNLDGGMARFVRVPIRCLHRLPEGVRPPAAAMTEPSCVAYQATVVNSPMRPGDRVVVIGPGPIGLLCAMIARLRGAGAVVLVGTTRDAERLKVGLKMGATHALDAQTQDVAALLGSMGDGLGPELVIDAAGVSASLRQALEWVRPAGHITKVGWGPQPLNFSLDPLVRKAVTLQGSFSHTWAVWEKVLALMGSGQLDVRPLVGLTAPLERWRDGFEAMAQGRVIKSVLAP
jgi:alcohol dehydrogenase/L-iditol 2-dehydrogenase